MEEVPLDNTYSIKPVSSDNLLSDIEKYCEVFGIPVSHFMRIISDQKVIPMLRGKGLEYTVYDELKKQLNEEEWLVEKLNLNPQPNSPDEDVVIVHQKTGIKLTVEVKSAVRGSFKYDIKKKTSNFKVKCHKSRSNKQLETNDRYLPGDFDLVITSPSNALILSGEDMRLLENEEALTVLNGYYGTTTSELFEAASSDLRFAFAKDIIEDWKGHNVVPRNPLVNFSEDDVWKSVTNIEVSLLNYIMEKQKKIA